MLIELLLSLDLANAQDKCATPNPPVPPSVAADSLLPPKGWTPQGMKLKSFDSKINGENQNLKYGTYAATITPAKGTVIYTCGGPGVPCMTIRPQTIPAAYNVVLIDYMGVGKNESSQSPSDMSIDAQAQMVAALARQIHDPHLLLFGESFGTTVATAAAAKLTSEGRNTGGLQGVILEGVVGKGRMADYTKGYGDAADAAWGKLSRADQDQFKSDYKALTAGMSVSEKRNVDIALTMQIQLGTAPLVETLKNFKAKAEEIKAQAAHYSTSQESGSALFRAAGCQIMKNSMGDSNRKIFGDTIELKTIVRAGACDCPTVAEAWRPDKYQIKGIPVLYINGGEDPATPFDGAMDHFDGQKQTSGKLLISPPLGGHVETMIGALKSCTDMMFDSVMASDLTALTQRKTAMEQRGCESAATNDESKAGAFH